MDPALHATFNLAHNELSKLFDAPGYKGYRPNLLEAPNSDGRVDTEKRFLHVAMKYDPPLEARMWLALAHHVACQIAEKLPIPADFYPKTENSTMRLLDYPAGAGTLPHTDFDLFTVNLWRSTPDDHEQFLQTGAHEGRWFPGAPDVHVGRLGQMIGLGRAMPHRVPERQYRQQALIYFAMPAQSAHFPEGTVDPDTGKEWGGRLVRAWVEEVTAASRVYK